MLNTQDNELLCHVEGNAPMGAMMRRHWIPVCAIEEVAEPGCDPVKIRLFGEDLVVFRDASGTLGLVEELCPHRRASFVYGRNEGDGLRCLYHGWKIDVTGTIREMPSEPSDCKMVGKLKSKAYEVREGAGLVWTYMGPAEHKPAFDPLAFTANRDARVSIAKVVVNANWAQVLEGAIDSAHSSSLHSDDNKVGSVAQGATVELIAGDNRPYVTVRPSADKAPRIEVQLTDYGMRYVALRHPIVDADTTDYARVTVFVAPFTVFVPPNARYQSVQYVIPMDNHRTMFYFIAWTDDTAENKGIPQDVWRRRMGLEMGVDLEPDFTAKRTLSNRHLQDRKAIRAGDFSGIRGIAAQDIAMWESMGPITDRSSETLGTSDTAIAQFRRLMVRSAKAFQDGAAVVGSAPSKTPLSAIRAYEGIIRKGGDWTSLGVAAAPARAGAAQAAPA